MSFEFRVSSFYFLVFIFLFSVFCFLFSFFCFLLKTRHSGNNLVAQAFQPVLAQAKACGYICSRSQAGAWEPD
jgi:hypothetical protein